MPAKLIDPDQLATLLDQHQEELAGLLTTAIGGRAVWRLAGRESIGGCAGYAVPKALVRLAWRTPAGRSGELSVVVKWFAGWHGGGEAEAYRLLAAADAPAPRCWGVLRDEEGDQVLLIERLARVGCDTDDTVEREDLVDSLAALHRLDPAPWLAAGFPDLRYVDDPARVVRALCALDRLLALDDPKLAQPARAVADRLRADPSVVRRLAVCADEWPRTVVHRDASPQNAGRRAGERAILWFDWHKAAVGCGLGDLLVAFDELAAWDDLDRRLAVRYLRAVGLDPALPLQATFRAVAVLRQLGFLEWAVARCEDGRVDWTDDRDEGRRTYRRETAEELVWLAAALAAGGAGT